MKKGLVFGVLFLGICALFGSAQQGVPSAKATADWARTQYAPGSCWGLDPGLTCILKTSEKADLILSLSAETVLGTLNQIKGKGDVETSTSMAKVVAKVVLFKDGVPYAVAQPGRVVFGYRLVILRGLFWSPEQLVPTGLLDLPEQFLELYMQTRDAHCFNFIAKNLDSGVYTIKVYWRASAIMDPAYDPITVDDELLEQLGDLIAVVGKRSLVVEAVRMVND